MAFRDRWTALRGVLWEARAFWMFLVGIAVALAAGYILARNIQPRHVVGSATVRYAGTLLQLFGVGLVAKGLSDARAQFGRPKLWNSIPAWFRRLGAALWGRRQRHIVEGLSGVAAWGSSGAVGHLGASPDATLEQRVATLEADVRQFHKEFHEQIGAVRGEIDSVKTGVQREAAARQLADREIDKKIEEFAVGGLHLEFVGVLWLLLGTLGTSVPDETATFLMRISH